MIQFAAIECSAKDVSKAAVAAAFRMPFFALCLPYAGVP